LERLRRFGVLRFARHDMYKHFNRLLVILSYTVNCFPPLIRDKESGVKEDDDVTETNDDIVEADFEAMIRDYEIEFPDLGVGATETVGEDINESSVEEDDDVTETNDDINESSVEEDDDVTETNDDIDKAIEAMIRDIRFPDPEVGATETVVEVDLGWT
jgi:hypothetical protein